MNEVEEKEGEEKKKFRVTRRNLSDLNEILFRNLNVIVTLWMVRVKWRQKSPEPLRFTSSHPQDLHLTEYCYLIEIYTFLKMLCNKLCHFQTFSRDNFWLFHCQSCLLLSQFSRFFKNITRLLTFARETFLLRNSKSRFAHSLGGRIWRSGKKFHFWLARRAQKSAKSFFVSSGVGKFYLFSKRDF